MHSNCETELEYKVSKLMFFRFLNTSEIKARLGKPFITSVQNFVRLHIKPHESYYCFFLQKSKLHFDDLINPFHEGTNNALRHSSAAIGPSCSLMWSMVVMVQNSDLATSEKDILNSKNMMHTKLYTSSFLKVTSLTSS